MAKKQTKKKQAKPKNTLDTGAMAFNMDDNPEVEPKPEAKVKAPEVEPKTEVEPIKTTIFL